MRNVLVASALALILTGCLTPKEASDINDGEKGDRETPLTNPSYKALLNDIDLGFKNEKGKLLFLKVQREPKILEKEMKIVITSGNKTRETAILSVFDEKIDAQLVGKVINKIQEQNYKLIESNSGGLNGNEYQERMLTTHYIFKKMR
jgi:hypothetical protein